MKTLITILFCCGYAICQAQSLKEKLLIDSLISSNPSILEIYVEKIDGSIVRVINLQWPDSISKTYNLLRGENKLIFAGVYPFSESGDWSAGFGYYFNDFGLFATEKSTGFFNSLCTDRALHETIINYYHQGKTIDSKYSLKDAEGNEFKKSGCQFPYKFEYPIYKTPEEFLKNKNLESR